jgi:hypothetical protein
MEVGSIAQCVTATFAAVALVLAYRSLSTQKGIARKRAAIDFFLKTEMDKEMRILHEKFVKARKELKKMPTEVFAASDHLASLCAYLDIHELMAVGVINEVFDEEVCFEFWHIELTTAYRESKMVIEAIQKDQNRKRRYSELCKLGEKWIKRLKTH